MKNYENIDCSVAPEQSQNVNPDNLYTEKISTKVNDYDLMFEQFYNSKEICNQTITSPFVKLDQALKKKQRVVFAQTFKRPISKQNPKGGIYNRYGTLSSYEQFLKIVETTDPSFRTYNEVIRESQPIKLTFDLEWVEFKLTSDEYINHKNEFRVIAPQYEVNETLSEFKNNLFIVAERVFNRPMSDTNLLILNSSRPIYSEITQRHYFKNSFHVYVVNYGYLPNLESYHKQFTQLLIDETKGNPILDQRLGISDSQQEKRSHIIDINVYKKNQNFRCVCCTKPNKNSYFLPRQKDYQQPIRHFFMGWITEHDMPLDVSKLVIQIKSKPDQTHKNHIRGGKIEMIDTVLPPKHLEEYVTKMLSQLKPNHVQEYGLWFDMMCRVYSTHTGLFKVFDQWSQQAPNYDADSCRKFWNSLYQSQYDMNSLLEIVGRDVYCSKQTTSEKTELTSLLEEHNLTLNELGISSHDNCVLNDSEQEKITKVVKHMIDDHKGSIKFTPDELQYIKRLMSSFFIHKGQLIPELIHDEYGYDWNYTYQQCPRDPLKCSKKNNFFGADYRPNTSDRFVQIDPYKLDEELTNGKYDTLIIKAPCGTAKSDLLVKLLTIMSQNGHLPDKFLIISALKSLATSLQERFMGNKKPYGWTSSDPNPNGADLKFYTDITTENDLINQSVNIVINSLPKLADFRKDNHIENYQRTLIAIDEWKSFLFNLCGRTLIGQRRQVISQLEYYLKNAPYVVVMDQNIDDDCLQTLFKLRDPKKTIIYDYQVLTCCDQTVYELHDYYQTLEILDRDYLSQGKLVYICCNSKKTGADRILQHIQQKYPKYEAKIYTSETPEIDKANLGKCEEDWDETIIVSPTVTYGVDYSKEGVFSATFCFVSKAHTIPANMVVQQIRRVRHVIDSKVFICDESNSHWERNYFKRIDDQITERLSRTNFPCPKMSQKNMGDNDLLPTKFGTKSKGNSDPELNSMLLKSSLGAEGRETLKKSWFSTVYRYYYRNDIESQQNMTGWIRGYMCANGFRYFVVDPNKKQDDTIRSAIKQELQDADEAQLKRHMEQYLKTPIQKESDDKLAVSKYFHCQILGLKKVDESCYLTWIANQSYHKINHLMTYLLSTKQLHQKQTEYSIVDYMETEKDVSACQLIDKLLEISSFDLRSHFFTRMNPVQVSIEKLQPDQIHFITHNKSDLIYYFGLSGRVRGQIKTSYHLLKFVSRIISSYLGLSLTCQQKRNRKSNDRSYEAVYSFEVPSEVYELLSYRVLSDRQRTLRWSLPIVICDQLRSVYQHIDKQMSHLAVCTVWQTVPEIAQPPKTKLKLRPPLMSDL
jgi:hypothetical protein